MSISDASRRLGAAGLASLTLLGSLTLAACGDDEKAAQKAPCGLTEARTGHLTIKNAAEELTKASAKRMTVRFRQEMTVSGKTASIEGSVDASPSKLYGLSQSMPGDDGTVTLIVKDEKVYVSAEGEHDGKFYVVDPDVKGDPLAAPLNAWFDRSGAAATATAWTAGLTGVSFVKKETLDDGTPTELYEFRTNPRLVARASGVTPPAGTAKVASSYVWVDRYNLIRKVESTTDQTQTVETLTHYCEPVDIKAPAAKDLIER